MNKRRISTAIGRFTINPMMLAMTSIGLLPPMVAILETTGRKSGKIRHTPIGNGLQGDTFWLVAEHGRRSAYVLNLSANPRVRIKVGSRWRAGTACVMPEDDPIERIRKIGLKMNGAVVRALGTDPTTVRIDLDSEAT
jgi:deazaflavin-dependent oxidoreductase (nitroreductase family)